MELSRNLSWPPSRSRVDGFILLLIIIAVFSCLSATISSSNTSNTEHLPTVALSPHSTISSPSSVTHSTNCNTPLSAMAMELPILKQKSMETSNEDPSLSSCDIFTGKWVVDHSDPIYQPGSCPFIDDAFNCLRNGRPDSDFMRWRWKPNGCSIPRLDGKQMLEMVRGKRVVFVGDSLNRNMWESLVCTLREALIDKSRVFEASGLHDFRAHGYYSFRFQDYNSSIEFVRAPFLVQEWKTPDSNGTRKETLRLDLIEEKSSSVYQNADIIVFNTGHWWTHARTNKGEKYFQEGNIVHDKLKAPAAYERALHTWAHWVDSNINSTRTRLFFTGYSISHYRGGRWNSGGNCDGETQPIKNETYLASYPRMMSILESVIREMKTPVWYLNITRMTDYRKDGHPSIYRRPEQTQTTAKMMYQDCSHWCLPGVPDDWNNLLYAAILHS
ncbi:hypothetical protein ACHQM5_025758 [Ranunculus cassubicifolius]